MLSLQSEAIFAVKQTSIKDKIKIGVSQSVGESIFPEFLSHFSRSYPDVKIEIETDNSAKLIQRYDQGKYDITLTIEKESTSGQVLGIEDMVWIGKEGFEWSNKKALPLASYTAPCHFRQTSTQVLD